MNSLSYVYREGLAPEIRALHLKNMVNTLVDQASQAGHTELSIHIIDIELAPLYDYKQRAIQVTLETVISPDRPYAND